MHSLRAVQPDWGRVVDQDGVCRDLGVRGFNRHEARVDTSGFDRRTRSIKGRLGDCVVVWCKLKLNHVSNSCLDVAWGVDEGSIGVSDLDYVHLDRTRGSAT